MQPGELVRKLQALTTQKEMLDQTTYKERSDALLSEIEEVEHRLAEISLDEQSLRQMEGKE